jgi:hypothetical protein
VHEEMGDNVYSKNALEVATRLKEDTKAKVLSMITTRRSFILETVAKSSDPPCTEQDLGNFDADHAVAIFRDTQARVKRMKVIEAAAKMEVAAAKKVGGRKLKKDPRTQREASTPKQAGKECDPGSENCDENDQIACPTPAEGFGNDREEERTDNADNADDADDEGGEAAMSNQSFRAGNPRMHNYTLPHTGTHSYTHTQTHTHKEAKHTRNRNPHAHARTHTHTHTHRHTHGHTDTHTHREATKGYGARQHAALSAQEGEDGRNTEQRRRHVHDARKQARAASAPWKRPWRG